MPFLDSQTGEIDLGACKLGLNHLLRHLVFPQGRIIRPAFAGTVIGLPEHFLATTAVMPTEIFESC